MIKVQLHRQQELVIIYAMIDSRATEDFIEQGICEKHGIQTTQAKMPREIYLADGKPSTMGPVIHTAWVPMEIESHRAMALFQVVNLKNYKLILGIPWLRKHSPTIEWKERKITFNSEQCTKECLETSPKIHAVPEAEALEENLITRLSYMKTTNQRVLVKLIAPEAKVPAKATAQAAGYDIYASERVEIPA